MNKIININIPENISQKVEKAFYEYNSSLNILSYLMKQKEINSDYLNQYFKKSEMYYIELEKLKDLYGNQIYKPTDKNPIGFTFNFINNTIEYIIKE